MDIFSPSILLAIFPYLLMGSFPIAGLIWVTKWVLQDFKRMNQLKHKSFQDSGRV
jgi:hypothetical protein